MTDNQNIKNILAGNKVDNQINQLIDSLHFNTFYKVRKAVKAQYPNVSDKHLRKIILKRLHDKRINKESKKIYQVKVFSPFPNAWLCDIFDNTNNGNPRYWYIFINVNTRFVDAYPMNDKTKDSIRNILGLFVNTYHPKKITSDEEAGLVANSNLDYLKTSGCGLYIIQEHNHTALSIIDRFMRTLRDMNKPTNEGNDKSTDDRFRYIDRNRMNDYLRSYNNTPHAATNHTPREMMNDKKLEEKYIVKCLDNKQRQQEINNLNLKEGSIVRYLLDRDKNTKHRYNISRESYKITSRNGNIYTIIAEDGSTKDIPRWKLIPVKQGEKSVKGATLNTDKGIVSKINTQVSANRVNVSFHIPDGSDYNKDINIRELRYPTPQFKSRLEIDYENRQH